MRALDRPTIDLDGEWRFVGDPERLLEASRLPEGEPITVPGCWEAQVAHQYRVLTAWYRRSVTIPEEWRGDRVLFEFDAVMYRCWIYLNGIRIGGHEGGYTPFTVDGQAAVRWGEANELVVEVFNPMNALADYPALAIDRVLYAEELVPELPLSEAPHGKQTWYSSQSGIWKSVRVVRAPAVHLALLNVFPDVSGERALVRWAVEGLEAKRQTMRGNGSGPPLEIELRVFDPDGAEVSVSTFPVADARGEGRVSVPNPRLWDVGQPNLYRIEARLLRDGRSLDGMAARFGMREISTRDGQILLNGRPLYIRGALDQDLYPDTISTPPSREYLDEQLRLAREMGLNLLRCHIKVPDAADLDAADEAGMLLWCELPSWLRFTSRSAARGRETLEAMIPWMANHPSIVIWTIINEDWGTRLRREQRDRRWLRSMYRRVKELDPTRLVVDNSACETPQAPNFHVRSDIADFHIYLTTPDNAVRWRHYINDFASSPAWLWSPHGDAERRGDEPLVLSEFGGWGLPRLGRMVDHYGKEPWWFNTGQRFYRPSGIKQRFEALGLDRVVGSVDELADATQRRQYGGLHYQIGELRRHASIQGYVITEFTDAYWESNGLLDAARGKKVFHDWIADVNAADVVIPDLLRRDLWGGSELEVDVHVSGYRHEPPGDGVRVEWQLWLSDEQERRGELPIGEWPHYTARRVGTLRTDVPDVERTTDGRLRLSVIDRHGTRRAYDDIRVAVVPGAARRTASPLSVAVYDPDGIWGVADRLRGIGHRVTGRENAALLVTTELTEEAVRYADGGGRVVVLIRARNALDPGTDPWRAGDQPHLPVGRRVGRRVIVYPRFPAHDEGHAQRIPWEGGWVSTFSWIVPGAIPGLPRRQLLDFTFQEVTPEHVMLGYDPRLHRDEVPAGMFVGWLHEPAATIWTFRQGAGLVTLTTFRLSPEDGPVATVMLEHLLQATGVGAGEEARAAAAHEIQR